MASSAEPIYESIDLEAENEHGVLHSDGQEALKKYFESEYSAEVVNDFYEKFGWMYEWKAHRRSEQGVRLAVAYSRALGLDEKQIKSYEDVDTSMVTEEHVDMARELHEIGKAWVREKFGDSVQVYRGFKNGGLRMFEKLYEDESDTIRFSSDVVQNWSWEIDPALEWGRDRTDFRRRGALVRAERDIEDFVFTIDAIAGDYVSYHDSALSFEGGFEVPKDQVSIELSSNSVRDYPNESDEPMDNEWVFYEGSFFPFRSIESHDIEAVKSLAIEARDSSIEIFLDDGPAARFAETIQEVRQYLESELDRDDPKDEQVLDDAAKAEESAFSYSE